jgi:outer membrane receptor protein involved in Fe transport
MTMSSSLSLQFQAAVSVLAVAVAMPGAALAQTTPQPAEVVPPEPDNPAPEATDISNTRGQTSSNDEIIVTGSRIRNTTYRSNSPIDVITRDDTILTGARNTAETLQSATITSGSAQLNDAFLGYVSAGGPAANTVGLRGLGASRTLVLLNGRRLAPAGAGPQLISADLNVLPASAVQRIEILREGASSVYGSDAIAGVINIITDTKMDGITLDAYTDQPIQDGSGGRAYRISGVAGKTFERGHIMVSVEYRQSTGLRVGDRKGFRCPTDRLTDPATGNPIGQLDPSTGQPRCFPFETSSLGTAQNYVLGVGSNGVNRYTFANGNINNPLLVNDFDLRPTASARQLEPHVISPLKTYTAYANGSYEVFGDSEVYAEGLFSRRKSHQDFLSQINWNSAQLGGQFGLYGGAYAPYYDYPTVTPFFPNSLANEGVNILRMFIVPPILEARQKVDFYRLNGGLRGGLGVGNLHYDANVMYSKAKSRYSVGGIDVRRFSQTINAVPAPAGTPAEYITAALPDQAGAGQNFTCATNVTAGAYNGGQCVAANFFDPSVLAGNLPNNLFNYLYQDFVGHTTFEQWTGQIVVDGSIVDLPAGPLGFALGAEYRHDKIADIPSEAAVTGNLYNYSSAGITKGTDEVWEVFGELRVPLLKEKPFAYELNLTGSARYTHYKSYGSDTTYRAGVSWAPIREIRFRGNYGTAFRAPNLYEQFVADQSGFYGAGIDPCDEFAARSAPGQPLYDNCLADLAPILGSAGALNYIDVNGVQVFTRGGKGNLKAEKSKSWGVGVIFEAPFADASLAIDYFNIEVRGEVNLLNNDILNRCYESEEFKGGNIYCSFIAPREPVQGSLVSFINPYLNIAKQRASGIDFSARFAHEIGPGKLTINGRATRNLKQEFQQFAEEEAFNYNGLLGYQDTVGGPKWVGDVDLRYDVGDFTFRWGVEYVGKMDSTKAFDPPVFRGELVQADLKASAYWEHSASVQWQWDKVGQFTLGVKNLFNEKPPIIGQHSDTSAQFPMIGNYFNYSGYDFIGRSVFVNVTRSF